jgi:primosomal protein N'
MADVWNGYRNGKGSLNIGKGEFLHIGDEITEKVANKIGTKALEKFKKQGCIKLVEEEKPVEPVEEEKVEEEKPKAETKKKSSKKGKK